MKTKLTLAHVLPPEIEQGRSIVNSWIRTQGLSEVRLLHLVQASAFVNIDLISKEFRGASLKGLISIALVKGSTKGALRAAFIDPTSEYAKELSTLLEGLGVPVYMGALSEETTVKLFLEERVVGGLNSQNKSVHLAGVTNISERILITLVKEALGIRITKKMRNDLEGRADLARFICEFFDFQKGKFRVYEEMALGALIDGLDFQGWGYLRNYRVDILVASAHPTSMPLLVIEFDGPTHDNENQATKDAKRDEALLHAGIPVLRISSKNALIAGTVRPIDSLDYRFFQSYIAKLVSRLAELVYFYRIESPFRFRPIFGAVANEVESLCDEYRRRESRVDIPEGEAIRIFEAACEVFECEFSEVEGDLALDEMHSECDWREIQDPEFHFTHSDKKVVVTVAKGPSTHGLVDTRDGFSTDITLLINGIARSVTSPRIFVELRRPAGYDDLVDVAKEAAVICLLEDMARTEL